ncbi:helix-turn-helix domain-containing protein [Salmonella enterica]|nr:helix-turn-helix domain-containing protein [Salmonella enterica subsp. enterica serovar Gaminara]EIP3952672.1 helix-turn-helix domain-containing protein [Salmonella enterica]
MQRTHELAVWLEQNLHCEITQEILEKRTGYSSRHLFTIFKACFGVSIANYVRKRRLTLASVMLRETQRSVTEIALMYQFDHLQTFTRAFKKQFGISPFKYRNSTFWDMKNYYPSAVVRKVKCNTHTIYIDKQTFLYPENKFRYEINYGHDFYIKIKNKKINTYPNIYKDCINLIFRHDFERQLVAFGELYPGKRFDTDVLIYIGHFTKKISPDAISIPHGYYFCFTFTGTPEELMEYHAWAKGHGMHNFSQIMKKGPTFTLFRKSALYGIYEGEFYIPCFNLNYSAIPD